MALFLFLQPCITHAAGEEFIGAQLYDAVSKANEGVNTQALDRVSKGTGLSRSQISALESGDQSVDLSKVCPIASIANADRSAKITCISQIDAYLQSEIDIAETEKELGQASKVTEVFSNGTLEDSPFDVIVDINIIDVLLFGEKADIALARWGKPFEAVPSPSTSGKTNGNGANGTNTDGNTTGSGGGASSPNGGSGSGNGGAGTGVGNGKGFEPLDLNGKKQCINPNGLSFTDLSNLLSSSSVNGTGSGIVANLGGGNSASGSALPDASATPPQWNGQFSNPVPPAETCKEYLFAGFGCLDSWRDMLAKGGGNCNPEDIICIIISYKTSERNLLGAGQSVDCVDCITKQMNVILKNLNDVVIPPAKNCNDICGTLADSVLDFMRKIGKKVNFLYKSGIGVTSESPQENKRVDRQQKFTELQSKISACFEPETTTEREYLYKRTTESSTQASQLSSTNALLEARFQQCLLNAEKEVMALRQYRNESLLERELRNFQNFFSDFKTQTKLLPVPIPVQEKN